MSWKNEFILFKKKVHIVRFFYYFRMIQAAPEPKYSVSEVTMTTTLCRKAEEADVGAVAAGVGVVVEAVAEEEGDWILLKNKCNVCHSANAFRLTLSRAKMA